MKLNDFKIILEQISNNVLKKVSLKEWNLIIKNIKLSFNNQIPNIINEMAGTFNQPKLLIEYINNIKIEQKIFNIKEYLEQSWQYYDQITNVMEPLFVMKTDLTCYGKQFLQRTIEQKLSQQQINILNKQLIEIIQDADGITFQMPEQIIMVLQPTYKKKTIVHELNHYFQIILKKDLIDQQILNNLKSNLTGLFIPQKHIRYLLSKKEFIPHINDFCGELNTFKIIYHITNKDLLNLLLEGLFRFKKTNRLIDYDNQFFNMYFNEQLQQDSLFTVLLSYILKYEWDLTLSIIKKQLEGDNKNE